MEHEQLSMNEEISTPIKMWVGDDGVSAFVSSAPSDLKCNAKI